MNIFLAHLPFFIGHILPVCSLFKKKPVLKNLIHLYKYLKKRWQKSLSPLFQIPTRGAPSFE